MTLNQKGVLTREINETYLNSNVTYPKCEGSIHLCEASPCAQMPQLKINSSEAAIYFERESTQDNLFFHGTYFLDGIEPSALLLRELEELKALADDK